MSVWYDGTKKNIYGLSEHVQLPYFYLMAKNIYSIRQMHNVFLG